jgi:membrane-associated phospholipid phosphatase
LSDPYWEPMIHTHPHPEYPSGHSTNSSAMATALALVFGDAPGVPIVATSPRSPTSRNGRLSAKVSMK